MKWRLMTPQARLRVSALAVLAIGFAAAVAIYMTAEPPPGNPLGYEPLDTKKYVHDLEVYGGKANVLAAEFREWFDSLWHGKQLAWTVAVIAVITAWALRFVATHLPPEPETRPSIKLVRAETADHESAGAPNGDRPTRSSAD